MKWKKEDVPFRVERSAAWSLSKQMTDGLREAIVSGRYKSGDVLPTILEWSRLLGVSIRVPEAAVSALAKEGLITVRKGYGCIVNPRRQNVWNGRVLIVVPDGDHVYYHNVLVGKIRFLVENRPEIERLLSKSGVAFGVFGKNRCALPGCVANFQRDNDAAVPDIVAHCERSGVRRILQVTKETGGHFDAVPRLREFGFEAEEWCTPVLFEFGRAEGAARGGQVREGGARVAARPARLHRRLRGVGRAHRDVDGRCRDSRGREGAVARQHGDRAGLSDVPYARRERSGPAWRDACRRRRALHLRPQDARRQDRP